MQKRPGHPDTSQPDSSAETPPEREASQERDHDPTSALFDALLAAREKTKHQNDPFPPAPVKETGSTLSLSSWILLRRPVLLFAAGLLLSILIWTFAFREESPVATPPKVTEEKTAPRRGEVPVPKSAPPKSPFLLSPPVAPAPPPETGAPSQAPPEPGPEASAERSEEEPAQPQAPPTDPAAPAQATDAGTPESPASVDGP